MNKENILKNLEKVVEHNRLEVEKADGDQGLAKNLIVLSHEENMIPLLMRVEDLKLIQ
ncbi:hypothetical protein QO179_05055 [Bacillus stercoris]|nr:hypothetical protein [Bacillus stercoris]